MTHKHNQYSCFPLVSEMKKVSKEMINLFVTKA